jgi:hypothetical protein
LPKLQGHDPMTLSVTAITPAMTFRPLSPLLARLIADATHELENGRIVPPIEPAFAVAKPEAANPATRRGLDLRA